MMFTLIFKFIAVVFLGFVQMEQEVVAEWTRSLTHVITIPAADIVFPTATDPANVATLVAHLNAAENAEVDALVSAFVAGFETAMNTSDPPGGCFEGNDWGCTGHTLAIAENADGDLELTFVVTLVSAVTELAVIANLELLSQNVQIEAFPLLFKGAVDTAVGATVFGGVYEGANLLRVGGPWTTNSGALEMTIPAASVTFPTATSPQTVAKLVEDINGAADDDVEALRTTLETGVEAALGENTGGNEGVDCTTGNTDGCTYTLVLSESGGDLVLTLTMALTSTESKAGADQLSNRAVAIANHADFLPNVQHFTDEAVGTTVFGTDYAGATNFRIKGTGPWTKDAPAREIVIPSADIVFPAGTTPADVETFVTDLQGGANGDLIALKEAIDTGVETALSNTGANFDCTDAVPECTLTVALGATGSGDFTLTLTTTHDSQVSQRTANVQSAAALAVLTHEDFVKNVKARIDDAVGAAVFAADYVGATNFRVGGPWETNSGDQAVRISLEDIVFPTATKPADVTTLVTAITGAGDDDVVALMEALETGVEEALANTAVGVDCTDTNARGCGYTLALSENAGDLVLTLSMVHTSAESKAAANEGNAEALAVVADEGFRASVQLHVDEAVADTAFGTDYDGAGLFRIGGAGPWTTEVVHEITIPLASIIFPSATSPADVATLVDAIQTSDDADVALMKTALDAGVESALLTTGDTPLDCTATNADCTYDLAVAAKDDGDLLLTLTMTHSSAISQRTANDKGVAALAVCTHEDFQANVQLSVDTGVVATVFGTTYAGATDFRIGGPSPWTATLAHEVIIEHESITFPTDTSPQTVAKLVEDINAAANDDVVALRTALERGWEGALAVPMPDSLDCTDTNLACTYVLEPLATNENEDLVLTFTVQHRSEVSQAHANTLREAGSRVMQDGTFRDNFRRKVDEAVLSHNFGNAYAGAKNFRIGGDWSVELPAHRIRIPGTDLKVPASIEPQTLAQLADDMMMGRGDANLLHNTFETGVVQAFLTTGEVACDNLGESDSCNFNILFEEDAGDLICLLMVRLASAESHLALNDLREAVVETMDHAEFAKNVRRFTDESTIARKDDFDEDSGASDFRVGGPWTATSSPAITIPGENIVLPSGTTPQSVEQLVTDIDGAANEDVQALRAALRLGIEDALAETGTGVNCILTNAVGCAFSALALAENDGDLVLTPTLVQTSTESQVAADQLSVAALAIVNDEDFVRNIQLRTDAAVAAAVADFGTAYKGAGEFRIGKEVDQGEEDQGEEEQGEEDQGEENQGEENQGEEDQGEENQGEENLHGEGAPDQAEDEDQQVSNCTNTTHNHKHDSTTLGKNCTGINHTNETTILLMLTPPAPAQEEELLGNNDAETPAPGPNEVGQGAGEVLVVTENNEDGLAVAQGGQEQEKEGAGVDSEQEDGAQKEEVPTAAHQETDAESHVDDPEQTGGNKEGVEAADGNTDDGKTDGKENTATEAEDAKSEESSQEQDADVDQTKSNKGVHNDTIATEYPNSFSRQIDVFATMVFNCVAIRATGDESKAKTEEQDEDCAQRVANKVFTSAAAVNRLVKGFKATFELAEETGVMVVAIRGTSKESQNTNTGRRGRSLQDEGGVAKEKNQLTSVRLDVTYAVAVDEVQDAVLQNAVSTADATALGSFATEIQMAIKSEAGFGDAVGALTVQKVEIGIATGANAPRAERTSTTSSTSAQRQYFYVGLFLCASGMWVIF